MSGYLVSQVIACNALTVVLCIACFDSRRWVMDTDHSMWNVHYVPLHHVILKSSLSTSFPNFCSNASETVGLLRLSRVEHWKLLINISSSKLLLSWAL